MRLDERPTAVYRCYNADGQLEHLALQYPPEAFTEAVDRLLGPEGAGRAA